MRNAVEDIIAAYGDQYPNGSDHLVSLDEFEKRFSQIAQPDASLLAEFNEFKSRVLLENPLVSGQEILFVVRNQYKTDHHNTATMFQTQEINTASFVGGGAMKAIDLANGGTVRTLINVPGGIARDPEVHYDGGRIIF
ncbi:MAG: hypothetical protein KAS23_02200, partial [Anaerohalosphaera sp.]|nr:hypothetical protein [Anaerohalosphaera sp.]